MKCKKINKNIIIITIALIVIIIADSIQAKVFNKSPIIHVRKFYNGGCINYVDMGIFVNTYKYSDGETQTVFCWESIFY